MDKKIVASLEDWQGVAEDLLSSFDLPKDKAAVLVLSGDLGVGKTSFVKALASVLGVEEVITSPTFNIVKSYQTSHQQFSTLVHMDAYRLESEDELGPLRFSEILDDPDTIVCIEWGERIKDSLPNTTTYFQLDIDENNQHTIQKVS